MKTVFVTEGVQFRKALGVSAHKRLKTDLRYPCMHSIREMHRLPIDASIRNSSYTPRSRPCIIRKRTKNQ